MLLPLFVSFVFGGGESAGWFLASIAITLAARLVLGVKKPENDTIFAKESFVSVALGWLLLSIFGAVPFFISGSIPSAIDCFFETVSASPRPALSILHGL